VTVAGQIPLASTGFVHSQIGRASRGARRHRTLSMAPDLILSFFGRLDCVTEPVSAGWPLDLMDQSVERGADRALATPHRPSAGAPLGKRANLRGHLSSVCLFVLGGTRKGDKDTLSTAVVFRALRRMAWSQRRIRRAVHVLSASQGVQDTHSLAKSGCRSVVIGTPSPAGSC
jgi:hypothetical protein